MPWGLEEAGQKWTEGLPYRPVEDLSALGGGLIPDGSKVDLRPSTTSWAEPT